MVLGQERQLSYLGKVLQNERISHVYLFYGPEGVGKFTVAKLLAEKLECGSPVVLDTEHTLLSKKEERKDIPVEDIRELKRIFSLAPEGKKWRVAVINQAERLSQAASDAFLKLLEEPASQTLFILVTSNPELLPQTVISRTQPIRFSLVPEKTLAQYLESENVTPQRQKEILWIADGRPGVMMQLLGDDKRLEEEKKLVKEIHSFISTGGLPQAFLLSEKISQDEKLRSKAIAYVLRFLRQKLLVTLDRDQNISQVLKAILRSTAILETTNVNPRLALDTIFLNALPREMAISSISRDLS